MKYAFKIGAVALLSYVPFATHAQVIQDCLWEGTAQAIVEPWEEHTRTFANGQTRLTLLDRIEPAAGAFHLHLLSPPRDELGSRQCRIISHTWSTGFAGVYWDAMQTGYDPAVGLLFDVPVQVYNPATAMFDNMMLSFTLNQSTGEIDTVLNPPD
ncbi:hypothetical protein [Pseudaestuariivita atlantica]|uniref:Uncharacterized protein n=1 Tax=Pseudaestuariivita atlantica TaxID=1317121 RepID=A0A0L1JSH3_9RHOB|nr:hypothetical protein [Pseudaestuariivita atlantica]KNG94657.1 hypothetical protein ATO11_04460 [Pseudaestuariivita atlantica]